MISCCGGEFSKAPSRSLRVPSTVVSANTKTLLVVTPVVPYPPARGVELRIFRMLRWLHAQEYAIILVLAADSLDPEALVELRKITSAVHWLRPALRTRLGARLPILRRLLWEPLKRARVSSLGGCRSVTENAASTVANSGMKNVFAPARLIALVQHLASKYRPDAVIAEYIFSVPVFSQLPHDTLKIIDTIDVFSRKDEQVLSFGIADPLACTADEEREYLLAANAIIAIQSRELTLLKELVPEREVFLAGMDCDVVASVSNEEVVPHSVMIVASDNALNIHGLTGFLRECWPAIKNATPSATLHVVGKVGANFSTSDPTVRFSGWVDNLDRVYREASVVINPTVAGTGLKIKSVQALAHGKPLVAWTNGVEGLDYVGDPPYRECRSWQEFADAVVSLLSSDVARRVLAERALSYATREFGADKVYADLRTYLENGVPLTRGTNRSTANVEGAIHTFL